jgi:SNF2 family DNA or RNA helicase
LFNAWEYLDRLFSNCVRTQDDLTEDQREAVEFICRNPFSALFCDVGFGKTCIVLTMLRHLILDGYTDKVLIIAPIRVVNQVWPHELRLWTHLAWMTMQVLRIEDTDPRLRALPAKHRTAEKHRLRQALLNSPEQIHVIDYHAVGWLVEQCAEQKNWPYRVVIFDESSRLRDHRSEVFKALKRARPYITRFHQLTATPASQSYLHLFAQIYLLDEGQRFGRGITAFRDRYFNFNQYSYKHTIKDGAAKEIERLIADICLVMRRKRDYRTNIRRVQLSRQLMRDYVELERELVLELPEGPVDAVNAAVLCGKLLQYSSGFVYDAEKVYHDIHDEKIAELRQLVDETLDEPLLVAYWFKASLRRLQKAFPDAAVMDREGKVVDSWNRREHKMLLVHPQSAGHGLNLQHGGRLLVIFDLFYSLELYLQIVGRLDRPGQTGQVIVHMLCAEGTIDETVANNLQQLRNTEEAMFRRLQELRDDVLSGAARIPRSGSAAHLPRRDTRHRERPDALGYGAL